MPSWLLTTGLITFSPWKVLPSVDYWGNVNLPSVQDRRKEEMGGAIKESNCEGNGSAKDTVCTFCPNTEPQLVPGITLSPSDESDLIPWLFKMYVLITASHCIMVLVTIFCSSPDGPEYCSQDFNWQYYTSINENDSEPDNSILLSPNLNDSVTFLYIHEISHPWCRSC